MSTPAHRDLRFFEGFDSRKRSQALPAIYIYGGHHPQRPHHRDFEGRTFVQLIDVSEEGKADQLASVRSLQIPLGREADMEELYGA